MNIEQSNSASPFQALSVEWRSPLRENYVQSQTNSRPGPPSPFPRLHQPTRPKNGLLYGKYGVYQIKPVCPHLYEVWLQMGDEMEFIYILLQNESAEERG